MKYAYSFNEELYNSDEFDTVAAALQAAKEEVLDNPPEYGLPCAVWIGEIGTFEPTIFADNIIDQLKCDAEESCGESAENYLSDYTKEQEDELTAVLTDTFHEWAKKYGQKPNFNPIENVQEFVIGGDENDTNSNKGTT